MAHAIPVNGPMGPEEPFQDAFVRLFVSPQPRMVAWEMLPGGKKLLSYLDVTEINPVASEVAGKTIYGDAIFYDESEY